MKLDYGHLNDFRKQLELAPTNCWSEKLVRNFITEVVKDCPMDVLIKMGEALADYRQAEIQKEAESN